MLSGLTSQFSGLINKGKEATSTTDESVREEGKKSSRSGSGDVAPIKEGISLSTVRSSLPSWLGGNGPNASAEATPTSTTSATATATSTSTAEETTSTETAAEEGTEAKLDKVKNLGSFLFSGLSTGIKSAGQKIKETPNPLTTFHKSQEKFVNELQAGRSGSGVAPWVGHVKEQELKEEIIGLSGDRRNFLRPPPTSVTFPFSNEEFLPTAKALLKEDPALEKMRYELVPKLVSEENFWRNYFYRVTLLKESLESPLKKQESIDTDEDEEENAELEKELEGELGGFEVVKKKDQGLDLK